MKTANTNEQDNAAAIAHNKKTHPHLANDEYFQCAEHSYTIRDFLAGVEYEKAKVAKPSVHFPRMLSIAEHESITDALKADLAVATRSLEFIARNDFDNFQNPDKVARIAMSIKAKDCLAALDKGTKERGV